MRLRTIETQRDMAALGTTAEREQWARVQRVRGGARRGSRHTEYADLRVRLALIRGCCSLT